MSVHYIYIMLYKCICLLVTIITCSVAIVGCSKADGAVADVCDPNTSFINTVKPILDKNCNTSGCHDDIVITALNNYQFVHDGAAQIKISVQAGRMPKGGKLSIADKNALFCWIDNGAKNN